MENTVLKLDKAPSRRWYMLLINVLTFCDFYIILGVTTALRDELMTDLQINAAQFTALTTGMMIAFAIFPYVGSRIATTRGPKFVIIVGLIAEIVVTAMVLFIGKSFIGLLVIRILQGAAGGLISNATMAFTPLWFPVKERGFASGFLLGTVGLGQSIATFVTPRLLAGGMDWTVVMAVEIIVPSVILLIVTIFTVQDIPKLYNGAGSIAEILNVKDVGASVKKSIENLPATMKEAKKRKETWACFVAAFPTGWTVYGFAAFLPVLLQDDMGLGAERATTVMGMTFFVGIIAAPLGGIVSDKIFKGLRWPVQVIGWLATAAALIILPHTGGSLVAVMLIAAYAGVNFQQGPYWTSPTEIVKPSAAAESSGICTVIGNTGGVIVAPIATALIALTGSSYMCVYLFAVIAVIAAIAGKIENV